MENLFTYCYDSPTMGRDNNGTIYEDLEAYCYNHFVGRARWEAIDYYRYAIIAKNNISRNGECIRVRLTPCCDSAYEYEIIQSSQISNIYVEDKFITEGDDVPDTAIDRDPDRIWFRALIFFNEPYREPVERYIYSEYIYIIFTFDSYYLGSLTNEEPVRVRKDPSRNNGWLFEVEKGTSVTILKTTIDNTWWYVNTPYGNGWVQRDYIQSY